ncbi:thioredoxin family protein [Chitinophaga pinensis]|uniref:Thioredoxin family protein n=1 Tax=Chitinophaga pinensis TaxID=79329 RepID=A0A5C6LMH6_9BACT|nr:thioredoxin family protein [Chitinophaga pinensis]TWV96194.1 thioredoxin family protein [Chitinophaga pinensis]
MKTALLSITCLICSLVLFLPAHAQHGPVTFAGLKDSMAVQPRPVVIELYTTWCSYCRIQEKQIKRSPTLQQLLSEKYYFVCVNAESADFAAFNEILGQVALQQLAYPAWILLDTNYRMKDFHTGLLKSGELEDWLIAK